MALQVLIRTPNHLGDCIMALPMINEAREAYPGSSVTVLVPDYLADIYESNPAIDRLIQIPAKYVHGLIAVKKITDLISPHNFDIGYILPPSFGAASSFKLGGVKERIGYIADGRRLLLSKPLALPTPLNSEHRSEVYFNLLRRGAPTSLPYVKPKLFLNDADIAHAVELLGDFGIGPEDRYVVVAHRAVAESRRWGTANYTELSRRLTTEFDTKVVLVGGGDDRPSGEEIIESIGGGNVFNLAGKTSLRESAAIMSRARLFIGNDSGPAHLAAAVGTPLVVLSGADDPKETSPISNQKRLLYLSYLKCISCVKNKCPLKGEEHMACMRGISVDMVMKQAGEALQALS